MSKISSKRAGQVLAMALALAAGSVFTSPVLAADARTQKVQYWSAWGGTVGIRWNRDLAGDVGMRLASAVGKHPELSWNHGEMFDLRQAGTLEFDVRNGNLAAFIAGSLQARGGHLIDTAGGRIDLTDFRLVPRTGDTPILDLVSSDGQAWFYIDRLMYELIDNNTKLAVRTMDLRISPALAKFIGHPEVADWAIADMEMTTDVVRQGDMNETPRGSLKWHGNPVPGVPGARYEADLFMQTFNTQYMRCSGCTGVGGNGEVVFAPNSTLRNNVNNGSLVATVPNDPLGTSSALYTADIPWYQKFSGNFPPYNNDQHPYLIWNLYRFNADGSIDQIGRSGVKHAFLTLNTTCIENPGNSHILGRGCSDLYSVGNNDNANSLGPRSEIIPASNVWGRCGSVYDTNCDGVQNQSGYNTFDQRLRVRESQISGAANAGATYRFENWYLARQDINILNSMASTNATFTRNSTTWGVGNQTGAAGNYRLGPVIDRWVDPAAPGPNERSSMVTTPEGSVKVAVKAIPLGNGLWRYHYAVMNLDFARARTEGAEPNLRVLSALGFDFIRIPVGTATITDLQFSDGDVVPANDWSPTVFDGRVMFTATARGSTLDWGTLFRFSFTANQGPGTGAVALHIASDNTRETVRVSNLLQPTAAGPVGR